MTKESIQILDLLIADADRYIERLQIDQGIGYKEAIIELVGAHRQRARETFASDKSGDIK
tara:strand:+ start:744 stop:923 length:180 start_codon:yes stop_codon:yes gene_type:complete